MDVPSMVVVFAQAVALEPVEVVVRQPALVLVNIMLAKVLISAKHVEYSMIGFPFHGVSI